MHTSVRLLAVPAQVFTDVNLRSLHLLSSESNAGTAITGGLWLHSLYVMRGGDATVPRDHARVLREHTSGPMPVRGRLRSVEA
jgi:hypothetical protein